jgi:hypothetical protein
MCRILKQQDTLIEVSEQNYISHIAETFNGQIPAQLKTKIHKLKATRKRQQSLCRFSNSYLDKIDKSKRIIKRQNLEQLEWLRERFTECSLILMNNLLKKLRTKIERFPVKARGPGKRGAAELGAKSEIQAQFDKIVKKVRFSQRGGEPDP